MSYTDRNAPRCAVCEFVDHGGGSHKCPPRYPEHCYVVDTTKTNTLRGVVCHKCGKFNANVTTNDSGAFVRKCHECGETFSGIIPAITQYKSKDHSRGPRDKNPEANTFGT